MAEPLDALAATVPGNPGDAAVNGWKTPVRVNGVTRMVEGKDYREWKRRAALAFRAAARGRRFEPGMLAVEVVAYWPRAHRQGCADGLAFGDVDAPTKAVLDALEQAAVIGDDAQVVRLVASKEYDKESPRIAVKVTRLEATS